MADDGNRIASDTVMVAVVAFAIGPPGVCESGPPEEAIVRAGRGTTVEIDAAFPSFLLIC